jgi:hypothetical protein
VGDVVLGDHDGDDAEPVSVGCDGPDGPLGRVLLGFDGVGEVNDGGFERVFEPVVHRGGIQDRRPIGALQLHLATAGSAFRTGVASIMAVVGALPAPEILDGSTALGTAHEDTSAPELSHSDARLVNDLLHGDEQSLLRLNSEDVLCHLDRGSLIAGAHETKVAHEGWKVSLVEHDRDNTAPVVLHQTGHSSVCLALDPPRLRSA